MIHIENTKTYGWNAAIRGMRNPLNSWDKFDTVFATDGEVFHIGSADFFLMKRLVQSGTDHSKFMRMITVDFDLTAPLYWWKEYDTYKIGTVANSCSTMHKIHTKEFVMDDFSHENLMETNEVGKDKPVPMDVLRAVIGTLNYCREKYIETNHQQRHHGFCHVGTESTIKATGVQSGQ